jgi:hypothetical protein
MKAWQIFAAGIAVLIAALLLPSYEPLLAGLAAVVMSGASPAFSMPWLPERKL